MPQSFLSSAYLSQPTIFTEPPAHSPQSETKARSVKDNPLSWTGEIAFVADDDLWKVPVSGGQAVRLTTNLGVTSEPAFSLDGQKIAFCSTDGGQKDIYLISRLGGPSQRLTYLGIFRLLGWKDNNTLLFSSAHASHSIKFPFLYELDLSTFNYKKLPYGPAANVAFGPNKDQVVLGRFSGDPARWKRYQGGTAGVLWVKDGKSPFRRILKNIEHHLASPLWLGSHLYFISDFEGLAQIYRCNPNGKGLKRLTSSDEFYIRRLSSDGRALVYQQGAEIYVSDLDGRASRVPIEIQASAVQAQPRFVDAIDSISEIAINPKADQLTLSARGHLLTFHPWQGGVMEKSNLSATRCHKPVYTHNGGKLVYVQSDSVSSESLHILDLQSQKSEALFEKMDWGKVWELKKAPGFNRLVLCNNRNQIFLIDLDEDTVIEIERSDLSRFYNVTFSPDARYIVYSTRRQDESFALRIYDCESEELKWFLSSVIEDNHGSFDPTGKYFYFLGTREFCPVYNATHFDLGFPFAGRPMVVTLSAQDPSPLARWGSTPAEVAKEQGKSNTKGKVGPGKDGKTKVKTQIDWEGLENRIEGIPVPLGGYLGLIALDGKILYARRKIQPIQDFTRVFDQHDTFELFQFNLIKQKEELFLGGALQAFTVNEDRSQLAVQIKRKIRLIPTKDIPKESQSNDRNEGWVPLDRLRLRIDPRNEWRQMYREAWELQKEHFWDEGLSRIDWDQVYHRYLPLLEKAQTRTDISDLLWEMQGELGTSHCYEFMGDYFRRPPSNPVGFLGAEIQFREKERVFEVVQIYTGDSWSSNQYSPLLMPQVGMKKGDLILAIDGVPLTAPGDLGLRLLNKAGIEVSLEILRRSEKKKVPEIVTVKPLRQQNSLLYREWVNCNRNWVSQQSGGSLGYVHIPDMGPQGYAEFYRSFVTAHTRSGLIVDVRNNGGGHVSQHILKVLNQKVLGFDQSRWHGVFKYPEPAVNGPIVALTNETAGSDGDIFSHSFKLMKIGPLIGKRTWGGVIGINGQYSLRDGTITTQPEFSFWFKDVGWNVENHGTSPDIEVDITPEEYAAGLDPQLTKALSEAVKLRKKNPPLKPDLKVRPNLALPGKPRGRNARSSTR